MSAALALTLHEPREAATDSSSQRRLFDAHADFVRRLAVRLGVAPAEADDLVQEVFLVAFRKLRSFDPARYAAGDGSRLPAERAWLYAIALRVAASARRRARLRRLWGFGEVEDPVDPATPASVLEVAEARRRVLRLVEGMSEKKRTVFLLFELEGLSGHEIARIVGAPLKTVWTRLFHARREFAKQLARDEARERGTP
jgi:RNA polymerase sigma-70 factor, ECF subfamily